MYLVIDIGNTNQKVALFNAEGETVELLQKSRLTAEDLAAWTDTRDVAAAIISSVERESADLYAFLRERVPTIRMAAQVALPIRLRYATPDTLGTDRIANAVGANHLFPHRNVLSIQAGTCLVTDLVTADNEYLGGTIAPGLRMRLRALEQFTAKLPLVSPQPVDYLIGDSTEKSILSGVVNGITSEIDGLIERYKEHYPDLQIVLTGGDAGYLESFIKNSIFAAPNLVLLGLYKILRFHALE